MSDAPRPAHFLAQIVEADLAAGRNRGRVVTRFPPEPNGFLHIGHAKSILLNFGLAERYGGEAHMRFDDTNPETEETEYVESILADVRWLGCDWGRHLYYASDTFDRMYECAERLVREGNAYVDSQAQEAIREQRGDFGRPGTNSPFRDRPAAESLDLFRRMRAGAFPDGACVLRARIDMAHKNVLLRDPLLYRIRHARHHRTGDRWCIYPMYDYAHPLEDAFEGVTHSICTLEFESNRELYDWVLDALGPWDPRPRQYEFARLALGYTVLSKRKLLQLVAEGRVAGWDDPRMPTLAGLRRRGVTPEALRAFADLIGVAKNNSTVDIGKLEYAIRADLEDRCPRALGVLDPLPITLTTWPEGREEEIEVPWWPAEPQRGGRSVPFGREILVERDDFALDPPAGWKRLAPGREVRLAGAWVIRCDEVIRGAGGEVLGLRCSHDPSSREGGGERRRAGGTIHWVHATRSIGAEVRLYDRLFGEEQPDAAEDFRAALNTRSLERPPRARLEPALAASRAGDRVQLLRLGWFFADPVDSRPGAPVWNRIVTLKDTWARPDAEAPQRGPARRPPEGAPPARKERPGARAEARVAAPAFAARLERYRALAGVTPEQADVLSRDLATAEFFDAGLAAGAPAGAAARWLVNDLLGVAGDRPLGALALDGGAFARFIRLVETGRVTQAGAKALLAALASEGGDPEVRLRDLGLEKVEDPGAVATAVDRALAARAAEVARYRAGEKKLLGFLLGAAMKEAGPAADPSAVRARLLARLGEDGQTRHGNHR